VFQSFSQAKRSKQRLSKAIQEQRGTNKIISSPFRAEVEQTKSFQNFSRSTLNKTKKSKKDQSGTKRTLPRLDPNGNLKLVGR